MKRNNRQKNYLEHSSSSQQQIYVQMTKDNPNNMPNRINQIRRNLTDRESQRQIINAVAQIESKKLGKSPRSRGINVISSPKEKIIEKREAERSAYISPKRCQVCCLNYNHKEMKVFGGCGHRYCAICLHKHVENTINSYQLVKCLNEDCEKTLDVSSPHIQSLNKQFQQRYFKITILFNKNNQDIRLCPSEKCEGLIKLSDVNFQCSTCLVSFCKSCLLPRHTGNCDDNGALFLTNKFHFQRCRCKLLIEKIDGCQEIKCKCGYNFCYICGQEYVFGHICKEQPPAPVITPAPAPVIAPVQLQVQHPAPIRAQRSSSASPARASFNQVQPSSFTCCNPWNFIKKTFIAIIFAFIIVLMHVLILQFMIPIITFIIFPILAMIIYLLKSCVLGLKAMIKQEKCWAILLFNIFLLIYKTVPIFLKQMKQFKQNYFSTPIEFKFLLPMSYKLYHLMQDCMF